MPLGNVYYYFRTKEELLDAVVREQEDEFRSRVARFEKAATPQARLLAFLDSVVESRMRHGDTPEARDFIARLWNEYAGAFPASGWVNYGPDAGYRQIELCRGGSNWSGRDSVYLLYAWTSPVRLSKTENGLFRVP